MIPRALLNHLQDAVLSKHWQGSGCDVSAVGGGCINHCYRLRAKGQTFFLKHNLHNAYPGMFEAEAAGLRLLASSSSLRIPQVIDVGHVEDQSYLVLEWIEQGPRPRDFWSVFGKQLAILHRSSSESFGLDYNNYIGSLEQINDQSHEWVGFFIEQRLKRQLKGARRYLSLDDEKGFDRLFGLLPDIFPREAPSLVHGDLWSGNFMCSEHGEPVLVDPAVYFGFREMDLGMMKLFGGFDSEMFQAYDEEFPMEGDWKSRLDICNLYPLLVHVNLFGEGYMSQIRSILKSIC